MLDRYGRPIEDLRITLTHACNFECFFCHMEGEPPSERILTASEIELVASVAKEFGVRQVKLTGGEPTLRRDLPEIVRRLKSLDLETSMTTNGFRLAEMAEALKDSGLDRVNVSVHAATRETFKAVTGVDAFEKVVEGVRRAVEVGLRPVKLNFVLNKRNSREWRSLIDLAQRLEVHAVQFIEMHPVGKGQVAFTEHLTLDEIEEYLKVNGKLVGIKRKHNRPIYELGGLIVELVKPYNNPIFCAGCNRVRLTADGTLKSCLYRNDRIVDVLDILKGPYAPEEKREYLREAFKLLVWIREPNFKWRLLEAKQAA